MSNKSEYWFDKQNHIHWLGKRMLTGTSSVGDVLFKPLAWWAAGEAVKTLGWTHPLIKKNGKVIGKVPPTERLPVASKVLQEIRHMTSEKYLSLLDDAYQAHRNTLESKAEEGTRLHADLENYIKGEMGLADKPKLVDLDPRTLPFVQWSKTNVKRWLWCEAHCYDEELGVGGISDCGVVLKDGSTVVIDHKSSREAYLTQFIQVAGYAIQLQKNGMFDEEGNRIGKLRNEINGLIIFPFGATKIEPAIRNEVDVYKKGFQLAVELYRILELNKKID